MDRVEFTDKLQHALAGGLNSSGVAENVRYYREYIDMEIRKGRSEEEVLQSLGDPRLLAKSIIEANKRAGMNEGTNQTYDEETSDNVYGENEVTGNAVRVPGWLILLILAVVFLLVIGVVFSIISVLAPVIIPVLIVVLVINFFKSRK
ncbi:MAG: DUF1700 domain-containing protein [Lachnospiraceae bacterium]|nr:DUF1700 domain-containing protein [Lachnospiraceae bacterium]